MIENRIHPIVTIRQPFNIPSHPPFGLWLTLDENWWKAQATGGIINLTRYRLDQSVTAFLQNYGTGNKKERRNRAIGLGYSLSAQDEYNSLDAWQTIPTTEEAEQLAAKRDYYQLRVQELEAEEKDGPLSPEKADLLHDYRNIVSQAQLLAAASATGRVGFVEEIDSIFTPTGKCLYCTNGVPNIPKVRRSTFKIDKDGQIHLAFRFAKPHPDQAETSFVIEFRPFLLELRGGHRWLLSKYSREALKNGTTYIKEGEAQLKFYLDQGRWTEEDAAYREERETQIRVLRQEIKDKKIKTTESAYKPYYDKIKQLRGEIAARQRLKQRAPGDAIRKADIIKKKLYSFYEQPINLNESDENFYNTRIRLTILPQRRGFLTFILNNNDPVTVDLPDILETKTYGTVWLPTPIELRSNGGAFEWQFLKPTPDTWGQYIIKDVPSEFIFDPDEGFNLDGDWDTTLPDTKITFEVKPSANFKDGYPLYDFIITFTSGRTLKDGKIDPKHPPKYIPWLYSLFFFINTGPREIDETPAWISSGWTLNPDSPNPSLDQTVYDVSLSYSDAIRTPRSMQVSIDLANIAGTLDLPNLAGRLFDLDIGLYNPADGVHGVIPYLKNGIINDDAGTHPVDMGELPSWAVNTIHRFSGSDLWRVVDDYEITAELIGDGRSKGTHIRDCLRMVGLAESEIAGVPTTGPIGGQLLKKSGAGEPPNIATRVGQKMGAYLKGFLNEYGMTPDRKELRLYPKDGVFTLDTPSAEIKFDFGTDGQYVEQMIKEGAEIVNDPKDFYNIFEVWGKPDRRTGERLKAIFPNYYSLLIEDDELYYPQEKRYPILINDALDEQVDVEDAVECLAIRNSKSWKHRIWETACQYPPLYPGDRGYIHGLLVEIVREPQVNFRYPGKQVLVVRKVVNLFG